MTSSSIASTQHPLPWVCFFQADLKTKMAALSESEWPKPGTNTLSVLVPAETYSTSHQNGIWPNLPASTQCLLQVSLWVFFGPIQKQRWQPLFLIGWQFSTCPAVTYMTEISLIVTLNNKFNSTQLNLFSSIARRTEFDRRNLTWSKYSMPSTKFVFLGWP